MVKESDGLSSRQELEVGIAFDRSSLGAGGSCVSRKLKNMNQRYGIGRADSALGWACSCVKHVLSTRHDAFAKGELATSRLVDLFGELVRFALSPCWISRLTPFGDA
jgi:hypothetical protein